MPSLLITSLNSDQNTGIQFRSATLSRKGTGSVCLKNDVPTKSLVYHSIPHQQCLFYGVMVIHFQDTSGWTTPFATVRRYPRIQGWHCQVPGLLPNHPSHSTLGLETYGSGIHKKLSNFHLEWFGRPWSVMNRLGHPHLMWVYHLRSYQKPSFGEKMLRLSMCLANLT